MELESTPSSGTLHLASLASPSRSACRGEGGGCVETGLGVLDGSARRMQVFPPLASVFASVHSCAVYRGRRTEPQTGSNASCEQASEGLPDGRESARGESVACAAGAVVVPAPSPQLSREATAQSKRSQHARSQRGMALKVAGRTQRRSMQRDTTECPLSRESAVSPFLCLMGPASPAFEAHNAARVDTSSTTTSWLDACHTHTTLSSLQPTASPAAIRRRSRPSFSRRKSPYGTALQSRMQA